MAAYLAIAAPCGLLLALLHSSNPAHESNLWTAAALIVILIAQAIGGAVAGAAQPTPLIHGAVAVAVPAGAFLVLRSVIGLAQGRLTTAQGVTFLLYLVVFTGLGMLGGYFGFRRRQRLA
jgi:quinol-cytochrome oxidoreductase complex cytochrome b subunit